MSAPERVSELLARVLPGESIQRSDGRAGWPACPLAAPGSIEEASEVLRLARSERWTVLPLGNGSRLGWSRPAEVDLVLSSRRLAGILAFEPADGTLTARSGTPWSELVAATRPRHHLSPELPDARSTLGGVIGAGASGFDRLRHGPLRHQILGIQALQADGTRVKSGGRVVKNVTGYDLHRLWCGSRGTLCFLLEATLRLHPAPSSSATLEQRFSALEPALEASHALWRDGVPSLAVVLESDPGGPGFGLTVVLAGGEEALTSARTSASRSLTDAVVTSGDAGWQKRAEVRERELAGGDWPPLFLSCRPSRLGRALERLGDAAQRRGWPVRITCHPLLATVAASFPGVELHEHVEAFDRELEEPGVTRRWRGLGAATPALAPLVSGGGSEVALDLMRRLKDSLDPQGLFVRGP